MINRLSLLGRGCGLAILAVALAGCNTPTPSAAETPPPPVTVAQPVARDVVEFDEYDGHVGAVDVQEVRARVSGYITKINFDDGQMVKKGDVLFEVDPRPYQAKLDAAEAQVKLAEAKQRQTETDVKRNLGLVGTGGVSKSDFDKMVADAEVAAASVMSNKAAVESARLDLEFTKIAASIPGKISRSQTTVGNLVSAGGDTLLTTITSVDPVYVYFDVDERALLRYRTIFRKPDAAADASVKDLKVPVEVALEGEKGYPHHGVLDFSDNRVNPGTGTIQVRGVLTNPKRLLDAGMRTHIRVPIGEPKKLFVTERAIGNDQGRKFVYVVNAQDTVEQRDVKLGRMSDGLQVINEGLKADDWVVVNGIQRVRDAMKVAPKKGSMPGATAPGKAESNKTGAKS